MTEEILETQETVEEKQEVITGKEKKIKFPVNPFSNKKKAEKLRGEFSRHDMILISLTGFFAFCGLIFCIVMIPLLHSIGY